jgi:hypothetical protein
MGDQIVAKHIRGMAFLGTPFHGSDAAKWATSIKRIVNVFYGSDKANLEGLETESQTLKNLGNAFPAVLQKRDQSGEPIGIVCFYEGIKTKVNREKITVC